VTIRVRAPKNAIPVHSAEGDARAISRQMAIFQELDDVRFSVLEAISDIWGPSARP
jgi:hypothetical protein